MTIVEAVEAVLGDESPLFCETVADLGWMPLPAVEDAPATKPLQLVGA